MYQTPEFDNAIAEIDDNGDVVRLHWFQGHAAMHRHYASVGSPQGCKVGVHYDERDTKAVPEHHCYVPRISNYAATRSLNWHLDALHEWCDMHFIEPDLFMQRKEQLERKIEALRGLRDSVDVVKVIKVGPDDIEVQRCHGDTTCRIRLKKAVREYKAA